MSAAEKTTELDIHPDPGDGKGPFVLVPLTKGKVAKVSPEDAAWALAGTWHASGSKGGQYARGGHGGDGGQYGQMHRLILGAKNGWLVDHKNRDGFDNRRGNIRLATVSQNNANRRQAPSMSKYRGVKKWVSKKGDLVRWQALISIHGRNRYIGLFATEEAAARAYDCAARYHHGEFAVPNFPRTMVASVAPRVRAKGDCATVSDAFDQDGDLRFMVIMRRDQAEGIVDVLGRAEHNESSIELLDILEEKLLHPRRSQREAASKAIAEALKT